MAVLMIFWDGVGYGKEDSSINPFFCGGLSDVQKAVQRFIALTSE